MEKEILQKIYLLRKVKPNASWEERTKQNILERDTVSGMRSFADVLTTPIFQNRLAVMGAFAFLLIFGFLAFPLFPLDYGYEVVYLPPVERVEEEEELKMVAEENEMVVDVAKEKEPIKKTFSSLEENLVNTMRQVLGSMVENGDEEYRRHLTDEEIINYHIAKLEGESKDDDIGMMTMSIEETEEDERLEMVKNARDNEDYGEAFDLLVDILAN